MDSNYIIKSFKNAWDMLIDFPLPLNIEDETGADEESDDLIPASFPVVGAVLGAIMYMTVFLISLIITVKPASAFIAAILVTLGSEILVTSSNTSTLTLFIMGKISRMSDSEIDTVLESKLKFDYPLPLILFLTLYLLKVFCIGLVIFYGKISWLILVFTLSYLVRSQLSQLSARNTSEPLIEVEDEKYSIKIPWIVSGIIAVWAGLSYLPSALVMLALTFALITLLKKHAASTNGVSAPIIGFYGAASELLFLIAGASIAIR